MNRDEILSDLARNKEVEKMIDNVGKGKCKHKEDLAQDIYLELMAKDPELIESLHEKNQLNYYISRIVTNNLWSVNSRYHYTYERYDQKRSEMPLEDNNDDNDTTN